MFFYSNFIEPEKEPFLAWLANNENLVRQGAAAYEGQIVTMESKLVRYDCVMSAILYTGRTCSPLMLAESEKAKSTFLRMTGLTLALGWWALFGLVYTPQALYTNLLKRGDKGTVSELLDLVHAPEAHRKSHDDWGTFAAVPLFIIGMMLFAIAAVFVAMFVHKLTGQ